MPRSNLAVRYNTPFGGFKQSDTGHELASFTETKNLFIATS